MQNPHLPVQQRQHQRQCAWLARLCVTLYLVAQPALAAIDVCVEDVDNAPFVSRGNTGLLLELLTIAAEQTQQKISYHYLPWKRCLTMVKQGAMDGALALVWTPERAKLLAYPNAAGQPDRHRRIWQGEYLIVVPRRSPLQWDGKTFTHITGQLGSPLGYASTDKLAQLKMLGKTLPPAKGLSLVAKGRLHGYVVQREIGLNIIQQKALQTQVKILPSPFMTEDWYLVFSHRFYQRAGAQAEQLWHAIGEARQRALDARDSAQPPTPLSAP